MILPPRTVPTVSVSLARPHTMQTPESLPTFERPFPALTPTQRYSLEVFGYVVIPNVLSRDECGVERDALQKLKSDLRQVGEGSKKRSGRAYFLFDKPHHVFMGSLWRSRHRSRLVPPTRGSWASRRNSSAAKRGWWSSTPTSTRAGQIRKSIRIRTSNSTAARTFRMAATSKMACTTASL